MSDFGKKVALVYDVYTGYLPHGHATKSVRYALPYYKSRRGDYFHRLRSASQHWRNGEYSHTSLGFWCGNSGQLNNGQMYSDIPEGGVLCATCEARAIGAGMDGARYINGRAVMYSPRSVKND